MDPRQRLDVPVWVEIQIVQDNRVCSSKIQTQTTSARCQQEQEIFIRLSVEIVNSSLAVSS